MTGVTPTFRWQPSAPAAYYRVQYDRSETFSAPVTLNTDSTTWTPTGLVVPGHIYWRVQLLDFDNQVGPYTRGDVNLGGKQIMPFISK